MKPGNLFGKRLRSSGGPFVQRGADSARPAPDRRNENSSSIITLAPPWRNHLSAQGNFIQVQWQLKLHLKDHKVGLRRLNYSEF